MTLADPSGVVVMNGGRIEQVGPPVELYRRPQPLFVAQFIGCPAMNIIDAGTMGITDMERGENVLVGLRPQDLAIDTGRKKQKASSVFP